MRESVLRSDPVSGRPRQQATQQVAGLDAGQPNAGGVALLQHLGELLVGAPRALLRDHRWPGVALEEPTEWRVFRDSGRSQAEVQHGLELARLGQDLGRHALPPQAVLCAEPALLVNLEDVLRPEDEFEEHNTEAPHVVGCVSPSLGLGDPHARQQLTVEHHLRRLVAVGLVVLRRPLVPIEPLRLIGGRRDERAAPVTEPHHRRPCVCHEDVAPLDVAVSDVHVMHQGHGV
mmetsp:Transcript_71403/g.206767  ORF Transcript_71403/g.206767 Transcript_71403/m.206767 type:complete len:232 (-) Transcript_71403:296-991(-)